VWRRLVGTTLALVAACSDAPTADADETTTGDAETTSSTDDGGEPPVEVEPASGGLRRLTRSQYRESIRVLLGDAAATAAQPPEDPSLAGFDAIAATTLALPPSAIEQYERSAMLVAAAATLDRSALATTVPCIADTAPDDGCYASVARDFGRLAWRRPLADDEIDRTVAIANAGRELHGGDFARGLQYAIAWLLQSPDFLYAVEIGTPNEHGSRTLDRDELATRLALFVLGHTPDADLFAQSDAGVLDDADGVRTIVAAMLATSAARDTTGRFFAELLGIRDLPMRGRSLELFPGWSPALATSMQGETLALVDDVVFARRVSALRLFDADTTFVDRELAAFYGVPAPSEDGFVRIALPAEQGRLGLLGHPAWLAAHAHTDRNSPTRRGLFVQSRVLCNDIPPPPGDIDSTLPDNAEPTTLRARMEAHQQQGGACTSCHSQTDPLGFAFEHFDATGARRELDEGWPIDASGAIEGLGEWTNAAELAVRVRDDPRVASCLVRQVYRHAIGQLDDEGQTEALAWVTAGFVAMSHDWQSMIVELAASPALREVGGPR
jgi:hypothetical protein